MSLSFQKPNQDWCTLFWFKVFECFPLLGLCFVWKFWNVWMFRTWQNTISLIQNRMRAKNTAATSSRIWQNLLVVNESPWQSIRKIKFGNYLLAVDEYYLLLLSIKLDCHCQDFYLAVNRYRLTANESYWLPMKVVDCKWKILVVNNLRHWQSIKIIDCQWKTLTGSLFKVFRLCSNSVSFDSMKNIFFSFSNHFMVNSKRRCFSSVLYSFHMMLL